MRTGHRSAIIVFAAILLANLPAAADTANVQRMVSPGGSLIDVLPKSGPGVLAPTSELEGAGAPSTRASGWTLQAQNDAVFTDLSMADATHGFASAELGRVYRTIDGQTWSPVMNVGFPRYWYGVHAFDPSTVFVSGFQNQTGAGIGRWSTDAGITWTTDLVIDPANWLTIVQFADRQHGIATAIGSGWTYYTTNGGATAADWTRVLADPTQGWFAGNFTFLPSLRVWMTGISFCTSSDGGATYGRKPSIDPVFDGGTSFPDPQHGWTGGGSISPTVEGWVHRTTDAGLTWSGRILNAPYPIRSLLFLDGSIGFAIGGNYFGPVGGIWSTTDGGVSWNLDVDTGCEMKGIDWARVNADSVGVWAAGSRSGVGQIYRKDLRFPSGAVGVDEISRPQGQGAMILVAPNPARGRTTLVLDVVRRGPEVLDLIDAAGRRVRSIELGELTPGRHSFEWDGRDDGGRPVAAGVYYAAPRSGASGTSIVLVR
ncbi:MAG: FlgD immunoglobulin-like domain containing protein [bacterium]